jgi:uncharacterized membrane protein YhaH (DUF805 family)
MGCYAEGWKKTFDYRGRSTRREFWLFIFINIIILIFIAGIAYFALVVSVTDKTGRGGMILVWSWYVLLPLGGLAPLVLLPPVVALGIRRMHDAGLSGWWFGGAILAKLVVIPLLMTIAQRILSAYAVEEMAIPIANFLSTLAMCVLLWLCCKPTAPSNGSHP